MSAHALTNANFNGCETHFSFIFRGSVRNIFPFPEWIDCSNFLFYLIVHLLILVPFTCLFLFIVLFRQFLFYFLTGFSLNLFGGKETFSYLYTFCLNNYSLNYASDDIFLYYTFLKNSGFFTLNKGLF